jgi:hypothetical protein
VRLVDMNHDKFDDLVDSLRSIGDKLVPYNFPRNDPRLEDEIHPLKVVETLIDGYEVVICFSKADYKEHFLETVQIFGRSMPFLPFSIVIKVAQKFLGSRHLSLVEIPKANRKVYCWTVCVDRNGGSVASPYEVKSEICKFEGFEYAYMQPDQVNLI